MVALSKASNSQTLPTMTLSKSEVAQTLRISTRSVHTLIATGELPAVRVGGRVLVRADALQAFLDSRPAVVAK